MHVVTSDLIAAQSQEDSQSYQLVVHPDIKLSKLERRELRNIFTLRRSIWPNGTSIQLVVLNTKSKVHEKFVENHLGLLSYQVERVWKRQVFSGASLSPIHVETQKELVEMVAKTPGSIGYIIENDKQVNSDEKVNFISLDK